MAVITGTENRDNLRGTPQADVIDALGGNDVILGSTGVDVIDGGLGYDRLTLRFNVGNAPGALSLGNSVIRNDLGTINTTFSNIENVTVENSTGYAINVDASAASGGYTSLAVIDLSKHEDEISTVVTGASDDILNILSDQMIVDMEDGNDRIVVGVDGPVLLQEIGNVVVAFNDVNRESPFLGLFNVENFTFYAYDQTHSVYVDASLMTKAVTIVGSQSSDWIAGGSGNDFLEMAGNGTDTDILEGNAGADRYYAGSFSKIAATTIIRGLELTDQVSFAGVVRTGITPTFIGQADFGGVAGQYRTVFNDGMTVIQIDGDGDGVSDREVVLEGRAFSLSEITAGSNVLQIDTSAGQLVGAYGADKLVGTAAAEFLFGAAGDDRLDGGAGNDLIEGDAGNDILRGGAGADVFLFDFENADTGHDRIVDFDMTDVLVVPEALQDRNGDGIITFGRDRVLNLGDGDLSNSDTVQITTSGGGRLTALEYDGFVEVGGMTYYVYSRIGSAAGVDTLTSNAFFDQLG